MIGTIKTLDTEERIIFLSFVVALVSIFIGCAIFHLCRRCRRLRNKRSATELLEGLQESQFEKDDESLISDNENGGSGSE